MTASSQPQIRTIHQLQNMLSVLWKNANAIGMKIPFSFSISNIIKKKQLKSKQKKYCKLNGFTNLINIVKIHWKPSTTFQSTIVKAKEVHGFKLIESSKTPIKIVSTEQIVEIDKALTDWLIDDKKTNKLIPTKIKDNIGYSASFTSRIGLDKSLVEWFRSDKIPYFKFSNSKNWSALQKNEKSALVGFKIAKESIESRSRFLVKSLLSATSETSQLYRLQEICKHLLRYPEEKNTMIKENAIEIAIKLRKLSETGVKNQAQQLLSLLGYMDPPGSSGIRILSIDGGGIRGIIAIQMLRHLEKLSGKPIHELFDYICGVSTGAIITMLIGALNLPVDECERLYSKMSNQLFTRSPWLGTSGLIWSHSYYDTNMWVEMLKSIYGEVPLSETSSKQGNPKISAISAVMNQPILTPFLFRNYALPFRTQSLYPGSCSYKIWQAIRASAAAPGYFEQYHLDGIVHQDGGLIMNNPTALAVHEAKLLWPKEKIQCVVSLGNGRFVPVTQTVSSTSTSLMTMMMKVIDSATDTESFHIVLQDHLPPNVYFRINPYMTERITLDEKRSEKLEQLKKDAEKYIEWNEEKIQQCVETLTKTRTHLQKMKDWMKLHLTEHSKTK